MAPTAAPELRIESVSAVVKGAFNPPLVSPGWLLATQLISDQEYEESATEAILAQLSVFRVAELRITVTADTLSVETESQTDFERARDVATSILRLLPHCPVNMVGINHYFHVAMASTEAWHNIGDHLAPKEPWEVVLYLPGTQDVTIRAERTDKYAGMINVIVQPSSRIQPWGIFVQQNDHFVLNTSEWHPASRQDFDEKAMLERAKIPEPSAELVPLARAVLLDEWTTSHARADSILKVVLGLAKATK
jgi:hypothetical protein